MPVPLGGRSLDRIGCQAKGGRMSTAAAAAVIIDQARDA